MLSEVSLNNIYTFLKPIIYTRLWEGVVSNVGNISAHKEFLLQVTLETVEAYMGIGGIDLSLSIVQSLLEKTEQDFLAQFDI